MERILVTGATGTVGSVVLRNLRQAGAEAVAASVQPGPDSAGTVRFNFTDPATWATAFAGVTAMFLMRPPAIGNVRRDLLPAVDAARRAGVRHVVFLSLQGADRIRVVPHGTVERWLIGSGVDYTFVRPSFFCQNLSGVHAPDIRDRDSIVVPAGDGATAFVDADDVAAVAATALLHPAEHAGRTWTVTGPQALTYTEVADILSAELGRTVRYTRPGLLRYSRHAHRRLAMPWPQVAVTAAIYTTARLGLAAGLTTDIRTVLGRDPVDFAAFARRERHHWTSRSPS
ncbi:NmrA family NAD(P)-binding protein [Micromonospora sp. NPDC126480]|uniref:NmrA family NAD(P)-binding protein n=1 Tax=Micromonospora sp. NPDC126480 TaxID=3155312 RepID=UPI0033339009